MQKIIFVLSLGLIFFLSVVNFRNLEKMTESTSLINYTYDVSLSLENVFVNVKDLETAKRNYILTQNDSIKNVVFQERNKLHYSFSKLSHLLKNNKEQQGNLHDLALLIQEKNKIVDAALLLPKLEYNELNKVRENLLKGSSVMYRIRNKITEMTGIENAHLKNRMETYDQFYHNSPIINLLGLLVTIALITFSFVMMLKKLEEVHTANEELTIALETSTMAEQIGKYGTWQYNVDDQAFSFSNNLYPLFGVKEESKNQLEKLMSKLCPEELINLKNMVKNMEVNEILGPHNCSIATLSGEARHLRYISKMVENIVGKRILLGVTSDITDEFLSQKNITEKNEELEAKNKILFLANETNKEAEITGNFGTAQWFIKENRFVFSENTYRLWGLDPSQNVTVEDLIKQVHPEDAVILEQKLKYVNRNYPFIMRVSRNNGKETRFISISSKHIKDEHDEEYFLIIFVDVTEVVQAQKTIIERNKELEEAYDKIVLYNKMLTFGEEVGKYSNWQWNIDENHWFFSDNLYRMMGEEPGAFDSTIENFLKYVHPDDLEQMHQVLKEIASTQTMPTFNYRILRPNGEIIYVKAVAKKMRDASGNKILVGSTIDITEEVLTNIEITQKNIELETSNKELQAFNYVASHDLQEPLRKIETFISRIEIEDFSHLSSNGKKYFNRIKISSERMRNLIDDLLQFSKTNTSEKVFEKTDINEILNLAKHEVTLGREDKKITIEADALPSLMAIPFQMKQLFINLLGNSLKYAKPNEPLLIKIQYEKVFLKELNNVRFPEKRLFHHITFSDNGIGFDALYNKKVFELFSRLHNKDEIAGTGIGLAICKKIVENHKGTIEANGYLGKGCLFTILLPEIDYTVNIL